jgi:hypothetical protein
MLHTLGVHSKLVKFREAGTRLLPLNNGSFNMKVFDSQTIYKLHLYAKGVHDLTIMGFSCQRLTWTHKEAHIGSINYTQIAKVEDEGRYGDTYCFTEPKRSMGMFGGILTGQCTEITLYANEEETFTCVLSSLNVSKYDEWKNGPTGGYEAPPDPTPIAAKISAMGGGAFDITGSNGKSTSVLLNLHEGEHVNVLNANERSAMMGMTGAQVAKMGARPELYRQQMQAEMSDKLGGVKDSVDMGTKANVANMSNVINQTSSIVANSSNGGGGQVAPASRPLDDFTRMILTGNLS